ncbi:GLUTATHIONYL-HYDROQUINONE REDUCTASE [Salix purpurea]|uniref:GLUTATHIONYL-HYDROQUINONE REDUCTASE n=1 Tax=Salix purpurea TaxID=77065 RepID=A0A9Q0P3W2_SALPP|nr:GLUTATHIONYL-HYDROQUINONE REDUCTASE [Salix purpurea]
MSSVFLSSSQFPIFCTTKTHRFACQASPRMSMNQTTPPDQQSPNPKTILSTITNLLWGQSLPPGLLISTVRTTWNSTWQLMMSQLAPSDSSGRTLIVRALKGLEDAVPISIAGPGQDGSWEFKDSPISNKDRNILVPGKDNANGCRNLKGVYGLKRSGGYSGRATVPMLWDVEKKEVGCNESYDIIEFFNSGLNGLARNPGLDLSPKELKGKIGEWNGVIYPNINNGVYRCGFAQSQDAYDSAVNGLFTTLEVVEDHLTTSRYLCGDTLTLADVCLFTTLIRFDAVYNVLFKCTKKKLIEYPNLHGYLRDIYQMPKVAETCNFSAIMDGYYKVLFPLNPGSICPVIPSGCEHEVLNTPHNRESLSLVNKTMHVSVA